jgi:hypothetical protein
MNRLEGVGKNLRDFRESSMAQKYREDIRSLGLGEASTKMLESLNIKPDYKKKDDPHFSEMREKLNREAGILIANHPGGFDIVSVLSTLNREDIKFVVAEEVFERWAGIFGKEHVLSAPKVKAYPPEQNKLASCGENDADDDPVTADVSAVQRAYLGIMREITDHIESGGLFIFFPTGGDDSRELQRFQFKDLFRVLIKKIKPETMVYSLNIRSDEMKNQMEQAFRIAGSFSDAFTGGKINWNRLKDPLEIELDENYSRAEEWKRLLSGNKHQERVDFTEHYLEQFPEFKMIVDQAKEEKLERQN